MTLTMRPMQPTCLSQSLSCVLLRIVRILPWCVSFHLPAFVVVVVSFVSIYPAYHIGLSTTISESVTFVTWGVTFVTWGVTFVTWGVTFVTWGVTFVT
jgi:hypothetical protein